MRAPLSLAVAAALAWPGGAWATQLNAGGGTAEFLKVGAGARALGMGEAFGPVAEGAEAIYWNPAGLAQARQSQVSYTRSEFQGFFHHDFLAFSRPIGILHGTLAGSYTRLSQETLPAVTNANIQVGEFNPHSDAFALAYAHAFEMEDQETDDRAIFRGTWSLLGNNRPFRRDNEPWTGSVMAGLAVKVIRETYYNRSATALAFDGGAIFRPIDHQKVSLSFAFRNAGSKVKFVRESESLPAEIDFGVAYDQRWRESRLVPAFELALPYYGNPSAKFGLEYQKPIAEETRVALRAGYKTLTVGDLNPLSGITFGIGTEYRKLTLEFGFQPMAELGQVYRMTAGLRW